MRFAHISDLHLGIRICDVKMAEDQLFILDQIADIIEAHKPDGVFISGDIYDRPIPPEESVEMLSAFLTRIRKAGPEIYMISGNHDSPERIDFATELLGSAGIHISGKYEGKIKKITKEDRYGEADIYLLPFIKPSYVNNCLPEEEKIESTDYDAAVRKVLSYIRPDKKKRNIILTHQFVQGATRSESEEVIVGFIDAIGADIYDDFDYVALGHLHKRQYIKRDTLLYPGTPLKYSFKEEKNEKSVTFVELKGKGDIKISTVPLMAKRDMRNIEGAFEDVMKRKSDDYVRVVLTDEIPIPFAFNKLRNSYPNILKLEYAKTKDFASQIKTDTDLKEKTPLELFEDFYFKVNGRRPDDEQKRFMAEIIEEGKI